MTMDRLDNGREYLAAAENGLNMRWPDVHTATTNDYTRATYLAMVDLTRAAIGIGRILDHLTSTATPDSAPDADLSTRCTATDDGIRRCVLTRSHSQDHYYLTRATTPPISTYLADGPCPDIPLECLPDGWRNAQHGETRALEAMPDSLRCAYSAYTSTGRTIRCARPHHHDGTPMHAAPGPGTE